MYSKELVKRTVQNACFVKITDSNIISLKKVERCGLECVHKPIQQLCYVVYENFLIYGSGISIYPDML